MEATRQRTENGTDYSIGRIDSALLPSRVGTKHAHKVRAQGRSQKSKTCGFVGQVMALNGALLEHTGNSMLNLNNREHYECHCCASSRILHIVELTNWYPLGFLIFTIGLLNRSSARAAIATADRLNTRSALLIYELYFGAGQNVRSALDAPSKTRPLRTYF